MSESIESVFTELERAGRDDLKWKDGRAFSLAYYAGPDVQRVADEAMRLYGSTNGLNADAFPSLKRFQSEVVDTVRRWLRADGDAAGFMTPAGPRASSSP